MDEWMIWWTDGRMDIYTEGKKYSYRLSYSHTTHTRGFPYGTDSGLYQAYQQKLPLTVYSCTVIDKDGVMYIVLFWDQSATGMIFKDHPLWG